MQLKKKARFTFKQSTIDENNKWLNQQKMAHARAMSPGYGKRREQVIEAVNSNPGMTRKEIAKAIGMNADKLTMLSKYVHSGKLRARKQDGWLRWYPANCKFSDDPKPMTDDPGETHFYGDGHSEHAVEPAPTEVHQSDQTQEKPERNAEIVDLRKQGWTLQKIALKYGVTRERVRQLVDAYEARTPVSEELVEEHPAFEPLPEPEYVPETVTEVSQKLEQMLTSHTVWLEQTLKDYMWEQGLSTYLIKDFKNFLAWVKALDGDKS